MADQRKQQPEAAQPAEGEQKPRRRPSRRPATTGQAPARNGSGAGTEAATGEHPAVQRAEELLNRMGERLSSLVSDARAREAGEARVGRADESMEEIGRRFGRFASLIGDRAIRAAARAREEVEDIWAEAQAIRRGDHS